jgi:hypothetical protein
MVTRSSGVRFTSSSLYDRLSDSFSPDDSPQIPSGNRAEATMPSPKTCRIPFPLGTPRAVRFCVHDNMSFNGRKPLRANGGFRVVAAGDDRGGLVASPWLPGQRLRLQVQQVHQFFGIGYGRFAGKILAHVGSGFAIDPRHRANRFVFLAEILLAFAVICQKYNCLW